MREVDNPYSPGAGRPPVYLAGRDDEIKAWETALARIEKGRDARPLALWGLRGVGKTVLLQNFKKLADNSGWITAKVEADKDKDLRDMLSESLQVALANLARPKASEKIKRALITATRLIPKTTISLDGKMVFGIDVSDIEYHSFSTGEFEGDLQRLTIDLSNAAAEKGKGFAILIDEVQDLSLSDLSALISVMHYATQEGLNFICAVAGLPTLLQVMSDAKSYAERMFNYMRVTSFDDESAKVVIESPAKEEGVFWNEDAVKEIIDITEGYPYFIQEHCSVAWEVADESPITKFDVDKAIPIADQRLDFGFFLSRWDRATPAQQQYLRAMADDNDSPSQTNEIAKRLNLEITQLGPRRAELISKGLIYSPNHGEVAFTVPKMADFIKRQFD